MLSYFFGFITRLLLNHALVVCVVVVAVLGIAFLPVGTITIDEQNYWQNAGRILAGELKQVCTGAPDQFVVGDYCVSKYNLGTSVFLLPAQALGDVRWGLITSLVALLAAVWLFSRLLAWHQLSQHWLYLFAFFPHLTFQSRTLLSEVYSLSLLLAVYYFLLLGKSKKLWWIVAGVVAGLAVWVRYTNVVVIGVMLAVLLWQNRQQIAALLLFFLAGSTPLALALALFNTWLYGAPWRSGYYFSGEEGLTFANLWTLAIYFVILNLVYPAMLISGWRRYSPAKAMLLWPAATSIIFYALSKNHLFTGEWIDIITGIRFLVPIIPFLLLAAVLTWHSNRLGVLWSKYLPIWVTLLAGLSSALHVVHNMFLSARL